MRVKPIKKNEINKKIINQEDYISSFMSIINKCIENDIFVISYKEHIDEGMSAESFSSVLHEFTNAGWKIKIKEFDIELS